MCKIRSKRMLSLLVMLCLFVSVLTACGQEVDATLADEELIVPTGANYKTTQVKKGTFVDEAFSTVKAFYPVEKQLFFNEPDVVFSKLLVKMGDVVKKGDRLAAFQSTASEVPLEEKRLELKRTRNSLARGKETRNKGLSDARKALKNMSSGSVDYQIKKLEIEKSEIEYDQYIFAAEDQIAALQEQIAELEKASETQYLRAPFSGTVGVLSILKEGDKVGADVPIVVLYSAERVLLQLDSANGFYYGQEVEGEGRNAGKPITFKGKVVCAPTALPSSLIGTPIYVMLEQKDINVETLLNTTVKGKSAYMPDVLTVDSAAVKMVNGKASVSILENDTVKKRYLTTVNFNKNQFWVLDGLSEGQTVIIE